MQSVRDGCVGEGGEGAGSDGAECACYIGEGAELRTCRYAIEASIKTVIFCKKGRLNPMEESIDSTLHARHAEKDAIKMDTPAPSRPLDPQFAPPRIEYGCRNDKPAKQTHVLHPPSRFCEDQIRNRRAPQARESP